MKTKSLVNYKRGYNPDSKKKCKLVEVNDNGTTRTFSVSGDKNFEYQLVEQLPLFNKLAEQLTWNGSTKFDHYGTYISGAFKQSWENEICTNYAASHQRTNPACK